MPAPNNLICLEIPRGLLVTWDVVTDGSSPCARSSIVYSVTVAREADRIIVVSMNNVKDTHIEITDSTLEPSRNYSIHVRTNLVHGTCGTDGATVTCRTSDDVSLTTAPPGIRIK